MIELLDSPGIIPARQFDQNSALALAVCNDIGEASYDRIVVAAAMCERINKLYASNRNYVDMRRIKERYGIPEFATTSGEAIVYEVAQKFYHGNSISAADRLLGDFRKNLMGFGSLEAPILPKKPKNERHNVKESLEEGSQLEEMDETLNVNAAKTTKGQSLDVGKGNYEGW